MPRATRLPGLDGVRGLACATVVSYHVWFYGPNGGQADLGFVSHRLMPLAPQALTMFFVLSGFLLYRPFVGAILRGKPLPSVRRYLRSRALRILPGYWVILVVTGLVMQTTLVRTSPTTVHPGALSDPLTFVETALFLQNYHPATQGSGISAAWSLNVEVVFYLLVPLLALLVLALARRARTTRARVGAALAPSALFFAFALSGRATAHLVVHGPAAGAPGWNGDWQSVIERSFWMRCDLIAFGLTLAVAVVLAEDGLLRLPHWWRKAAAASIAALFPLPLLLSGGSYVSAMAGASICALILALVVLPPPSPRPRRGLAFLECRPVLWLGLGSYSVFLWHDPIVRWLVAHGAFVSGSAGYVLNVVVAFAVTGVFSAVTYRCIEAPAMRLRHRERRAPAVVEDSAPTSEPAMAFGTVTLPS
jgi:peptidoglycan/LPS O-acetylase OafA/YrhL